MDLRNRSRRFDRWHPTAAVAARHERAHGAPPVRVSSPRAGSHHDGTVASLPPSVARVAERTRLSAELLAAILEVEARTRVSLDDIERADALADRLLARRRDRLRLAASA